MTDRKAEPIDVCGLATISRCRACFEPIFAAKQLGHRYGSGPRYSQWLHMSTGLPTCTPPRRSAPDDVVFTLRTKVPAPTMTNGAKCPECGEPRRWHGDQWLHVDQQPPTEHCSAVDLPPW